MNPSIPHILKLIPGKVFLIKLDKTISFSTFESENSTNGQPCHKIIFHSEYPCHYCLFFNEESNDPASVNLESCKQIQIKIPQDNSNSEDITLNQSRISIDNIPFIIDILEEVPIKGKADANDQLTTLGAHVQTMAHELSNPLTGLNLTYQKMESIINSYGQQDLSKELMPLMDLFKKDIFRASEIISEIRNYSRPISTFYKIMDLKQVLKSAIDNTARTSGRKDIKVAFKWNLTSGFQLRGNAVKLEQCFINILKNSFEMFNIRKNILNPEIIITVNLLKSENSAIIQIIDNAGGISKTALKNVFKPYFTTKEKFRGLGLGLYIAGKILKEHQSTIDIESIRETTKVTIKIPNQETRQ